MFNPLDFGNRPRKLYIVINPFSGASASSNSKTWVKIQKMFQAANIHTDVLSKGGFVLVVEVVMVMVVVVRVVMVVVVVEVERVVEVVREVEVIVRVEVVRVVMVVV